MPPPTQNDLTIGQWTYSLPTASGPSTASANARIYNNSSGGTSGSLELQLELSTTPYGDGGLYYTAAEDHPLSQLDGGFNDVRTVSSSFDINSVPNGTYYVLLVLSEYNGSGYTIRDGSTANNTYTIGPIVTPTPPPVPLPTTNGDRLAAYRPSDGTWSLDTNANRVFDPPADQVFYNFSPPGAIGISGDWNNTGHDAIGDFKNGQWNLDNDGDGIKGPNDQSFTFGQSGDTPVVGNFYGTGTRIGVFRTAPDGIAGEFIIDTNGDHIYDAGDETFIFGRAGDRVVVGDWNGTGIDNVGVFRSSGDSANSAVFSLDVNGDHTFSSADQVFTYGIFTDGIVIGDWSGSGSDEVGVYRSASGPVYNAPETAVFSLDDNNSHSYDSSDEVFLFGNISDQFVAGKWAAG